MRTVIDEFDFLEDFETPDEDSDDDADEVVFDTGQDIAISRSHEVLPRFADALKAVATDGVKIKFETRHDFDEDQPWVVEVFESKKR